MGIKNDHTCEDCFGFEILNMLCSIAGDIVGSVYEWDGVKTTDLPLFRM